MTRQTSIAAYEEVKPKLPKRESEVLDLIKKAGPQGLTSQDVINITKLPHQSATATLTHLYDKRMIKPSGIMRKNKNAKDCEAWIFHSDTPICDSEEIKDVLEDLKTGKSYIKSLRDQLAAERDANKEDTTLLELF